MDTADSSIEFDDKGQCSYCNNFYNVILPNWNNGKGREKELFKTVESVFIVFIISHFLIVKFLSFRSNIQYAKFLIPTSIDIIVLFIFNLYLIYI